MNRVRRLADSRCNSVDGKFILFQMLHARSQYKKVHCILERKVWLKSVGILDERTRDVGWGVRFRRKKVLLRNMPSYSGWRVSRVIRFAAVYGAEDVAKEP
jgi:hypothetical protein